MAAVLLSLCGTVAVAAAVDDRRFVHDRLPPRADGCSILDSNHVLDRIFDAENLVFTAAGHLIVSGGDNVFFIDGLTPYFGRGLAGHANASAVPILRGSEYSLGLSIVHGHLFMATRQHLFVLPWIDDAIQSYLKSAGRQNLSDTTALLLDISFLALPNGMATDGVSRLYLADSAYADVVAGGGIYRIDLSIVEQREHPVEVLSMTKISTADQIMHPNGLRFFNNSLWATDIDTLKELVLSADGAAIADMRLLWHGGLTLLDDLALVHFECEGQAGRILAVGVCDIFRGSLHFIDVASGQDLYETPRDLYHGPSALALDPSSTPSHSLFVTNKGVVEERDYAWGDYLSNSPLSTCPLSPASLQ